MSDRTTPPNRRTPDSLTPDCVSARDDVLIVGAGVIGLMTALRLLREGRSVRVIDQATPGSGASHGNCGTITPSHAPPVPMPGAVLKAMRYMLKSDAPLYVKPRLDTELLGWFWRFAHYCNPAAAARATTIRARILLDSRQRLGSLIADEALHCDFEQQGTWYVFHDAAEMDIEQRLAAPLKDLGIDSRCIDGGDALRDEPALRDGVVGVIEFPGDARLRPDRLIDELVRRVTELGGLIESDCAYRGVTPQTRGVRVETSRGTRIADWLLIATGAWSPALLRPLGLRVPMQPGKGYSMTWSEPALTPRRSLVLHEASVCVTCWDKGFRLGSTMEFSGYDSSLNRTRLDALVRGASRYLHQPTGPELQEEWYGWRPMMADDLPLIGPVPGQPRVLFAGGHGMMGVSMSATTAQLIADRIAGRTPCIDDSAFDPARFSRH